MIFDSRLELEEVLDCLPCIWKNSEHYGIDLVDFVGLPMHGMTLGVEKAVIPQVHRLFNRRIVKENTVWKRFLAAIRANHKKANELSLDWCMAMPFSGGNLSITLPSQGCHWSTWAHWKPSLSL